MQYTERPEITPHLFLPFVKALLERERGKKEKINDFSFPNKVAFPLVESNGTRQSQSPSI